MSSTTPDGKLIPWVFRYFKRVLAVPRPCQSDVRRIIRTAINDLPGFSLGVVFRRGYDNPNKTQGGSLLILRNTV